MRLPYVRKIPHFALKLVVTGKGTFGRHGGTIHDLVAPVLFWQRPGVAYEWGPGSPGWDIEFVHFSGERGEELICSGFDQLSDTEFIALRNADAMTDLFHQLAAVFRNSELGKSAHYQVLLERILLTAQLELQPDIVREKGDSRLTGILQRLTDEPGLAYDFEYESSVLDLSYSHFRRLFREYTGVAPQEYLIQCRIRTAGNALISTNTALKQIAADVGYNDAAYFGRLFRKRMGISPGAYRREHRLV